MEENYFEFLKEFFISKNFKVLPFRKVIEKLFASRKKHTDELNTLLQNLGKLLLNSLYGIHIRKDISEFEKCKSQHWMETDSDDNVLDC